MSVKSMGVSITIGGLAMLAMPMMIRSIFPSAAPQPTEPHVPVNEAYCVVSPQKTAAVILDAGTREVLFQMKNGVREGATLMGEAFDTANQNQGELSVAFDDKNHALQCARNETIYAISWRGGYNFDAH